MPCPTHGTTCAYQQPDPALCPVCHANWDKITKAATYVAASGIGKDTGEPWQVLNYTGGYGETREEHAARHAAKVTADAEKNRRRAAKVAT